MFSYQYEKGIKQVRELKGVPAGTHFVVLIQGTRSEYQESYDYRNGGSSGGTYTQVPAIEHYVVENADLLQKMIAQLNEQGKKYVFYHVKNLGKVDIQIKYDIET